jgi:Hint module
LTEAGLFLAPSVAATWLMPRRIRIKPQKDNRATAVSQALRGISQGLVASQIATVQLFKGETKRMDELDVGDRVHVGSSEFSPVFIFTHKVDAVVNAFIQLHTASGHSLSATPGHYLCQRWPGACVIWRYDDYR